jgi:hypothetical protein
MTRSMLALTALLLTLPSFAQAQQDTTGLVPGRRIRVHQPNNRTVVGNFVAMDSTSLGLETSLGDTLQIARAGITGVDLSVGTKSQAGKGAVTGLLIGGAAGVVIGLAASGSDDGELFDFGPGTWAAGSGLFFGAVGAGVGALIGAGNHTDRWEKAALPAVVVIPNRQAGTRIVLAWQLRL